MSARIVTLTLTQQEVDAVFRIGMLFDSAPFKVKTDILKDGYAVGAFRRAMQKISGAAMGVE